MSFVRTVRILIPPYMTKVVSMPIAEWPFVKVCIAQLQKQSRAARYAAMLLCTMKWANFFIKKLLKNILAYIASAIHVGEVQCLSVLE